MWSRYALQVLGWTGETGSSSAKAQMELTQTQTQTQPETQGRKTSPVIITMDSGSCPRVCKKTKYPSTLPRTVITRRAKKNCLL